MLEVVEAEGSEVTAKGKRVGQANEDWPIVPFQGILTHTLRDDALT